MFKTPIAEAVDLIERVAEALSRAAVTTDIDLAADLRQAVGDLVDRAEVHLRAKTMGDAMRTAFDAAAAAGAGVDGMDQVRAVPVAAGPSTCWASPRRRRAPGSR